MVTDIGGLNDRSFNESAYNGLKRAQSELGVDIRAVTSKSNADYVPNLTSLARQKYDLVIGVGFLMAEAMEKVSNAFPDTNFAIIDSSQQAMKTQPKNVEGLLFKENEAGYLVGYMAGLYTKDQGGDQVISSVGGQKIPPVDGYIAGYQAGAKAANPDIKTLNAYSQDFVDQAKCKELALNQIAEGSQVVFQVAGACGLGALDAAKEKGVQGIGVDADQAYLGDYDHDVGAEEDRRGRLHDRQGGPGRLVQGRHRHDLRRQVGRRRVRQDERRRRQVRGPGRRAAGEDQGRRDRHPGRGHGQLTDQPTPLALELKGVTKRFGALTANDSVDFDLRRGEVHALLGENGAGKSTLMNVLYGLLQPDEGEVHLRGEPVHIGSPREAIGMRIGMVHQHFMLIPVMTVAENVVLASEPRKGVMLDRTAAERRVRELSERFGLSVDPRAYVEDIGVGQQQRVEILRVLHRGADILILDEPTAVLTAQEIEELFAVLRALTAEGVSVIFISHKLREVLEIADRVTVLRRGKKIDTVPTEGATEASLAKLMVGRDVLFRVEKDARAGGRRAARGRRPRGARRPRAARAARPLAPGPRRRDRRHRRRRRQRPVRARRGDHRAAAPRWRATSASAGATSPAAACAARSPRASGTSPRTATGAASCCRSRSPRTSRCASTGARR